MNKYHKVPIPLSAVLGLIFLFTLLAATTDSRSLSHWLMQFQSPAADANIAARDEGSVPALIGAISNQ